MIFEGVMSHAFSCGQEGVVPSRRHTVVLKSRVRCRAPRRDRAVRWAERRASVLQKLPSRMVRGVIVQVSSTVMGEK